MTTTLSNMTLEELAAENPAVLALIHEASTLRSGLRHIESFDGCNQLSQGMARRALSGQHMGNYHLRVDPTLVD